MAGVGRETGGGESSRQKDWQVQEQAGDKFGEGSACLE